MDRKVRVRFAPSPTGGLHIGGVRTALYNYLIAKKYNGTMILRIEDTDQTRYVEGAEEYIREALEWIGITLDESPWHGGEYAPYRQSERKAIYKKYVEQLIKEGHAYYAFDTEEEWDKKRKELEAAGVVSPQYNSITRMQMKNSLTLSEEEVKAKLTSGEPYVVRLKVPRKEDIRVQDMIRGWVVFHSSLLDDKVLLKSDGMPTYHLANVVDDYLMEISHVIRGEEWLPSAPIHILLYKYFGWEQEMPQFAHLPLILNPDGNGKLSKRYADQLGFPVFPLQWKNPEKNETMAGYREEGYLPEAMVNFLVLLGWNAGTEQEIFSIQELTNLFSIERIGKSGTKFDINKAKWFNQQYLKGKSNEELTQLFIIDLNKKGIALSQDKAEKIVSILKERVTFVKDFMTEGHYLFHAPTIFDEQVASKKWNQQVVDVLLAYKNIIQSLDKELDAHTAKELLNQITDQLSIKFGSIMQGVRLAITGGGAGADLMEIIAFLGEKEVSERIDYAITHLKVV
ncbi:MAG: glutamate--tRNA ligase [Thermoflexibacter sp.]|jgi:glutamyl-tRNA synthetase|nr:glutamate--tRNA ligase [Thermoflexibacter sp.]